MALAWPSSVISRIQFLVDVPISLLDVFGETPTLLDSGTLHHKASNGVSKSLVIFNLLTSFSIASREPVVLF